MAAKLLARRWNPGEQNWSSVGPKPHRDFIKMIVGYALTCKMPIAAVSDTIVEARCQARRGGRTRITAGNLRSALLNYRIPSDAALQQAFQPTEKRRKLTIQTAGSSFASVLQRPCMRVA